MSKLIEIPKLKKKKRSLKDIGADSLAAALNWQQFAGVDDEERKEFDPSFSVFKDSHGDYRWTLVSGNAYRDRDREIISTKALVADVDRTDQSGDYGPLRFWHVPGLDIGDCDFRMVGGRMLIESGTFRDPGIAQAVAKTSKEWQASLGFNHPASEPDSDGVFHHIRVFERSLVPSGRAANPWTNLTVKGVESMATIGEKVKAFRELLKNDDLAKQILEGVANTEKDAALSGADFKEASEEEQPQQPALKATTEIDTSQAPEDPADFKSWLEEAWPQLASELKDTELDEESDKDLDEETTKADEEETTESAEAVAETASEDEDEAEEDEEEEEIAEGEEVYLSELTVGEFAEMMAEALDEVFGPYFDKLDEISAAIGGAKPAPAAEQGAPAAEMPAAEKKELDEIDLDEEDSDAASEEKESSEDPVETAVQMFSAMQAQIDGLINQNAKLKEDLERLDSLPRDQKRGFRPSQDESTVLKEGDPLLTQPALVEKSTQGVLQFIDEFVLPPNGTPK